MVIAVENLCELRACKPITACYWSSVITNCDGIMRFLPTVGTLPGFSGCPPSRCKLVKDVTPVLRLSSAATGHSIF